jgi:hypothetical protein
LEQHALHDLVSICVILALCFVGHFSEKPSPKSKMAATNFLFDVFHFSSHISLFVMFV